MIKSQFIYSKGVPVTVTRLDGSSYQTRMLYHRTSRQEGTFASSFVLSTEFMRGGIFRPTDDIQNGYIVNVNVTGEQMFIAAFVPEVKFGKIQSINADMILLNFPTQVQLYPSQAAQNVPRDKFGKPISSLASTTIGVTISKADLVIKPEISGGKPIELLEFYARTNTIHENDEIVWNGHRYRTTTVWPFGLADTSQIVLCKAQREIDL
jgi:hypothetical protein